MQDLKKRNQMRETKMHILKFDLHYRKDLMSLITKLLILASFNFF